METVFPFSISNWRVLIESGLITLVPAVPEFNTAVVLGTFAGHGGQINETLLSVRAGNIKSLIVRSPYAVVAPPYIESQWRSY